MRQRDWGLRIYKYKCRADKQFQAVPSYIPVSHTLIQGLHLKPHALVGGMRVEMPQTTYAHQALDYKAMID